MIEQEVEVIAVENNRLLVEAEQQSSCQSCAVKSGCGTSVLAKWFNRKRLRFYVDNTVNATVGDHIHVGLQESALTQGALMIYLLPIIAMIGAALLVDAALPADFYWRDLLTAASAFAGLGLSLYVSRFYLHQKAYRQRFNPIVLAGNDIESHSEKN